MNETEAMQLALREARIAMEAGDVPVGAILLRNGKVIARGHNQREVKQDATAHAELVAIREACEALDDWRLTDTTLVVTLEPCVMCAGAILAARISKVTFGAADPKAGAVGTLYNVCSDPRLNHETEVASGIFAEESSRLLKEFFSKRRKLDTER